MPMTEKEWQEFERTRGKPLLRELIRGMVYSTREPSTPTKHDLRKHKPWVVRKEDEDEQET